jgi:hypothetical protein
VPSLRRKGEEQQKKKKKKKKKIGGREGEHKIPSAWTCDYIYTSAYKVL